MKHYYDRVQFASGAAAGGATVTVYVGGTSQTQTATIYSDDGITPKSNPFTADANGNYDFYVADGRYDILLAFSGASFLQTDVEVADITQQSSSDAVAQFKLVQIGGSDTGISRASAGVIDIGNGNQGDVSGAINAANHQVAGVSQSGTGPLIAQTNATLTTPTITSPTLTTPTLGAATATSINKVAITAPASAATLTIANNKTLTANSSLTLAGVDAKTLTIDNSLELAGTDGIKHTFPATAPTGGVLAYGQPKFQLFTSTGTFTIPTGVTTVKVTLIGGGGAGGGATAAISGGGGASGAVAYKWLTSITPANTIAVTIGAGGTGVSAANGNAGGNSTIASGTQPITTVTAFGGNGGFATVAQSPGGAGNAAVNGDINGSGSPGGNAAVGASGIGGCSFLGGGGNASGGGGGNAATANTGSGGSGGLIGGNSAGGNGAAGIVIFEWVA